MGIEIVRAKPEDWETIQKLNNEVFVNDGNHDDDLDLNWPFSEVGVEYYKKLADGKYGHCLIAMQSGVPAGYVALAIKDFGYRKSKYVEIENIGVNPEFRSQGIGHLLMQATEKWAREQNATKLYVSAYFKNEKAISFYKREGFYESGLELDKKLEN
jgi:GNAT superfamily N-acetyltransferase